MPVSDVVEVVVFAVVSVVVVVVGDCVTVSVEVGAVVADSSASGVAQPMSGVMVQTIKRVLMGAPVLALRASCAQK